MPSPLDHSPPRLSDVFGEARLDALYRRAAADRARFEAQRRAARDAGPLARLMGRLRSRTPLIG